MILRSLLIVATQYSVAERISRWITAVSAWPPRGWRVFPLPNTNPKKIAERRLTEQAEQDAGHAVGFQVCPPKTGRKGVFPSLHILYSMRHLTHVHSPLTEHTLTPHPLAVTRISRNFSLHSYTPSPPCAPYRIHTLPSPWQRTLFSSRATWLTLVFAAVSFITGKLILSPGNSFIHTLPSSHYLTQTLFPSLPHSFFLWGISFKLTPFSGRHFITHYLVDVLVSLGKSIRTHSLFREKESMCACLRLCKINVWEK